MRRRIGWWTVFGCVAWASAAVAAPAEALRVTIPNADAVSVERELKREMEENHFTLLSSDGGRFVFVRRIAELQDALILNQAPALQATVALQPVEGGVHLEAWAHGTGGGTAFRLHEQTPSTRWLLQMLRRVKRAAGRPTKNF
jgi:hypothetical protein